MYGNEVGRPQMMAAQELPDMHRIQQSLARANEALVELGSQTAAIANELFGPPPPIVVGNGGEPANAGSHIDEIHRQCRLLEERINVLGEQIERLKRLV